MPKHSPILLTLLVALLLRVCCLDAIPPGLTHDEAANGHDGAAVLRGVRPIYFTIGYGHEPLYPYSVSLTMLLLGPTVFALRLTTVFWGMATLLLTYALARRMFGPAVGLAAAGWLAVSFWGVMTSRVGLRAITLPATFTASAWAFWPAVERPTRAAWWRAVLAGALLGLTFYTYMASRGLPAVYLLLPLVLWAARPRRSLRPLLGLTLLLLLTGALVAAPLVHFLVTHPGAEQRIGQLARPLEQARHGDFAPLWQRIAATLPMLTFHGDPLWLYNISGRPLLDLCAGGLFYLGLLILLRRWRDPRHAFLLLWLALGLAPALLTGPDATVLRAIAAQPAIFIIAGRGTTALLRYLRPRRAATARLLTVLALAYTAAHTAHDYFAVWGEAAPVRVAYHHALVAAARYLDAQPEGGVVALSSIYPGPVHDPYTLEITLRRTDLSLRWFDGRSALIIPAGDAARYVIPSLAPLDDAVEPFFAPYAVHVHTTHFRPDDLTTRFDVYRLDSAAARAAFLPASPLPAADFGPTVRLLGYDLRTPRVPAGGTVELLTFWRVLSPCDREAVIFVHLLDDDRQIIGQVDRLDVPTWDWQPGDLFVQIHRFPVNDAAPPGPHPLELGLYTRPDLARLPLTVAGEPAGDHLLLPVAVEVTPR